MTLSVTGPGGRRPGPAEMVQLASMLGQPDGLFGSGYREFMARQAAPGPGAGAVALAPFWEMERSTGM